MPDNTQVENEVIGNNRGPEERPSVTTAAIISPQAPESELFKDAPHISEELKNRLSPKKLRELLNQYRASGVTIIESAVWPEGETVLLDDKKIVSKIPKIVPLGNDVTAVHEFTHIEQIINALRKPGFSEDDFRVPHSFAIGEIGARKAEIEYIDNLPWSLKRKPAYKDRRREAEAAIEEWAAKLPSGLQVSDLSRDELFDPYKTTINNN